MKSRKVCLPSCVLRRNGVPELGLSVVQIVDRVEIHVFGVPREGGFPHAEVEVGSVHAVDLDVVVLVHPVQDRAKILDVPVLKINGRNATLSN